jgi:hypothetical protein
LLALGCLLASFLPVVAAAPYEVHRTSDAATTRGSVAVASVSTAPFDDAPGLLQDGLAHYYVVTDANGEPVRISVHANPGLDTVRLGFDDENPWSAPVDASLSTVEATPSTIPADGSELVEISIVPRDASGVPLGAGLAVAVDNGGLWPGYLAGPVVDNGDGSYTVYATSTIPGSGEAWVSVEGTDLDEEPGLTYEDTGAMDLREQAIARLEDLTAPGGLFDDLLEGLDLDKQPGHEIDKARADVEDALGSLYDWDDYNAVGHDLRRAVHELAKALADPRDADPEAIRALIDHLVDAARLLAVHHITVAEATCGACGHGGPPEICDARNSLRAGDEERDSSPPDFVGVIDAYADAVDKAEDACE